MQSEIPLKPAIELLEDIRSRRVSVSEVVQAVFARIEALDPAVNAVCTLNPHASEEAAACDRRLASGADPRPLEGLPFVVKDNISTKGIRTTFGSKLFEDHVPDEDSITVERLRTAGGILIGKTNTPEFAHDVNTTNKIFGTTRNPWNLDVTPGGSSGGTAAAVAAGFAALGLGTDFGGSIREPASFCGIVGLRPAPGRVPVYPAEFAWDLLVEHVQGPMTRTVADAGLMLTVLAGPDDRDPSSLPYESRDYLSAALGRSSLTGRRIAYTRDLNGLVPVDPQVAALTREAALQFERLGCRVEEDCFDVSGVREIISGTRAFAMVARYSDRLERFADLMTAPLIRQVRAALAFDVRAIARAERLRAEYWHRVRRFLEVYDYILAPTVGAAAFHLDRPLPSQIGDLPVTNFYDVFLPAYAFSIAGLPAISVPCGFTSEGLPVGLQIVGRRLREDAVLEAAGAYAVACPEHFRLPTLSREAAERPFTPETSIPGFHIS